MIQFKLRSLELIPQTRPHGLNNNWEINRFLCINNTHTLRGLLFTVWSGTGTGISSISVLRQNFSGEAVSTGTVLTANFFPRNLNQDKNRFFFRLLLDLTTSSDIFLSENPKQPRKYFLLGLYLDLDMMVLSLIPAMEEREEEEEREGVGPHWEV